MLSQDDPLFHRIRTTEGVRPASAPIPSPGIYWLKISRDGFYWVDKTGTRLDNPTHNRIYTVHTWEKVTESGWFLALVGQDDAFTTMGSDEDAEWEGKHFLVTRVGPKVEPPEESNRWT